MIKEKVKGSSWNTLESYYKAARTGSWLSDAFKSDAFKPDVFKSDAFNPDA